MIRTLLCNSGHKTMTPHSPYKVKDEMHTTNNKTQMNNETTVSSHQSPVRQLAIARAGQRRWIILGQAKLAVGK